MNTTSYTSAPLWPAWQRFLLLVVLLGLFNCCWAWGMLQFVSCVISFSYAQGATGSGLAIHRLVVGGWALGICLHAVVIGWSLRQQHKAEALAAALNALWLTALCFGAYLAAMIGASISDVLHNIPAK